MYVYWALVLHKGSDGIVENRRFGSIESID